MFYRMSAAVAAAVLLLSGCGAWQSVSDASTNAYRAVFFKQVKVLDIDLIARAALNPDDAGRPTSVAVRVYQLKDRKMVDAASYDDLLKNDRTILAQDLQGGMSAVVNPGLRRACLNRCNARPSTWRSLRCTAPRARLKTGSASSRKRSSIRTNRYAFV